MARITNRFITSGSATPSQVLTADGAGNSNWLNVTSTVNSASAVFSNQQTSGTPGGSITAGSWTTTPINTTDNSQSWASLSSNQITLQAGTYYFDVESPSYSTDHFQTRLQNITDSTTAILGSSEYESSSAGTAQTSSFIKGVVTIAAAKTFEIQMYAGTTSSFGFGVQASFGTEVYCRVAITQYTSVSLAAFTAYLSADTSEAANTAIVYDATDFDTTSSFNTSTGLFTAPATGVYFFSCSYTPNSGSANVYFAINGTTKYVAATSLSGHTDSGSSAISLTAGDTVGVFPDTTRTLTGVTSGVRLNSFSGFQIT